MGDRREEVRVRAIRRQYRILQRAVRRGERSAADLEAYAAEHAATLAGSEADDAGDETPTIPHSPPDASAATPFSQPDGKPIHLRDFYAGSPVFLILSGPSLRNVDLSLLNKRGVITFGVNNSPAVLRTNLWTFVDKPQKFHDAIWRDPAVMKFVPTRHIAKPIRQKTPTGFEFLHRTHEAGRSPVKCGEMPGVVCYERNAYFEPSRWLEEPSINWGNSLKSSRRNRNHRCLNTMFAVLKICHWLGFKAVYLVGCDFHMTADRPYGFDQGGDANKAESNNNGYRVMSAMLEELKPRFDAAGFHVFNCTPDSGLTVFPYVPYIEAVRSAVKHVPQDPLDTAGWYD